MKEAANETALAGLYRVHGVLDFVRQLVQVPGKPAEHFALGLDRNYVTDELGLRRIAPQLFGGRIVISHSLDSSKRSPERKPS